MLFRFLGAGVASLLLVAGQVEAKTICTVAVDAATGKVLVEEGACKDRVTPASTFKVALSVIGFDAGFLKDEHHPTLKFKKGDSDWGGPPWKQPTDAVHWLKYSVVWYSQRIARALGEKKLHDYAVKMDYGNADFSGDPGKNNGLDRAWIMSSLKVSPLEQTAFLQKLVNRTLPVSRRAMDMTVKVVETFDAPGGWRVQGKTGTAFPRISDTSFDESRGYGWFVGWAEKDGRVVVFARLIQDEEKLSVGPGVRARAAMLKDLPALIADR